MPIAQDIYNSLMEDPNLEVGEFQTREEAAQTEADFRERQHMNNVKALSLATEPLEEISPIKALLQHVASISKTMVSGAISIAQDIRKAKNISAMNKLAASVAAAVAPSVGRGPPDRRRVPPRSATVASPPPPSRFHTK